ncbi:MAG: FAD-dependent oxidoreductase [Oscillospiraceae bacterium]|nr:FAD-dependent oxidoreductase [Oscillospiraceae bacterium]
MRRTILRLVGKLYRRDRRALAVTGGDPLCRVLDTMLDLEQAEVAAAVRPCADTTAEEIADASGKNPARATELLHELMALGVVLGYETEAGMRYRLPPLSPGLPELMLLSDAAMTADDENAYWLRKSIERRQSEALVRGDSVAQVYPVQSETPEVLIRNAKHVAVAPCACARLRRFELGEGCDHSEEDRCVLLGIVADSAVRAGLARPVTADEALALLRDGAAHGLTQLGTRLDGSHAVSRICTACSCACTVLKAINETEDAAHTIRAVYRAEIDADACSACGACVERCATNALALGLRAGAGSGTAPCLAECPAHIPVQSILRDVSHGQTTRAAARLLKTNPLPGVTGAVCDRPCEWFCARRFAGGAVDIAGVESALAAEAVFPAPKQLRAERIAVIGSGPAGLSCAAALAAHGYQVTIFEKESRPGGALSYGIGADRLPETLMQREVARLLNIGVELRTNTTFGKDFTLASLRAEGYQAICLAAGTQGTAPLKLDGAELAGVKPARDWLRDVRAGSVKRVSGDVVVLGAGRIALQAAHTAKQLGAERVFLAARRTKLHPDMLAAAEAACIELRIPAAPTAITGTKRVSGVVIEPLSLVVSDGKSRLQRTGEAETLPAALVLNAQQARADWSAGAPEGVEQNRNGTLIVDGFTGQTAVPDVFAVGDVVTGTRSVIEAIDAGLACAESIRRYVTGGQDLQQGRGGVPVPAANETAQQIIAASLTPEDRQPCTTPEGVCAEAARCPSCGTVTFDNVKCIGCGSCETVCRYDAIRMRVMA